MNRLLTKLRAIEAEVALEKGAVRLFGMFALEGMPDQWDLVVSAPWVPADQRPVLDYLAGKLRAHLSHEETRMIARIVLVPPDTEFVRLVNGEVEVEHGAAEVKRGRFEDVVVDRAWVVTSRRDMGVK